MIPNVKICGLKTLETLQKAQDCGANSIGFVFFAASPRNISLPDASALRGHVRHQTKTVAVTVDAETLLLDEIVSQTRPDILQLHGSETPDRIIEIKNRYHLPVMKSISIYHSSDLQNSIPYQNIVDSLVFDTKIVFDTKLDQHSALPGGNGIAFDWNILKDFDKNVNYVLSGGLKAENVAEAIAITGAYAIDVSSGVEKSPGIKDINLIENFFASVNHLNSLRTISVSNIK